MNRTRKIKLSGRWVFVVELMAKNLPLTENEVIEQFMEMASRTRELKREFAVAALRSGMDKGEVKRLLMAFFAGSPEITREALANAIVRFEMEVGEEEESG